MEEDEGRDGDDENHRSEAETHLVQQGKEGDERGVHAKVELDVDDDDDDDDDDKEGEGGAAFQLGDRVHHKTGNGTIRYVGETQFQNGLWVGVELDEPLGKNDGEVQGVRYFQCPAQHGLFARIEKVSLLSPSSEQPKENDARDTSSPRGHGSQHQHQPDHHSPALASEGHPQRRPDEAPFSNQIQALEEQLERATQTSSEKDQQISALEGKLAEVEALHEAEKQAALSAQQSLQATKAELAALRRKCDAAMEKAEQALSDSQATVAEQKATIASLEAQLSNTHPTEESAHAADADVALRPKDPMLAQADGTQQHQHQQQEEDVAEAPKAAQSVLALEEELAANRFLIENLTREKEEALAAIAKKDEEVALLSKDIQALISAKEATTDIVFSAKSAKEDLQRTQLQLAEKDKRIQSLEDGMKEAAVDHQTQLAEAHSSISTLQASLAEARQAHSKLLQDKETLQVEMQVQGDDTSALSSQLTALKDAMKRIQGINTFLTEKDKEQEAELSMLRTKLSDLELKNDTLQCRVNQKENEIVTLRDETTVTISNLKDSSKQLLDSAKKALNKKIDALTADLEQEKRQRIAITSTLTRKLEQVVVKAKQLEKERTSLQKELDGNQAKALKELEGTKEALAAQQEALMTAKRQAEQAKSSEAAMQAQIGALSESLSELQKENSALEEQLTETVAHIHSSKRIIELLEESLERSQARLDEAVKKGAVPPLKPSETHSIGTRERGCRLILSIPSVMMLKDSKGRAYHVYQIYVTMDEQQWVLYRRYSEILAFQREARGHLAGVDSIPFPKKVALGSRSPKVAEERRLALQYFLQNIVELARHTEGTPIQQELSKPALLLTFPFFSEEGNSGTLAPLGNLEDWDALDESLDDGDSFS